MTLSIRQATIRKDGKVVTVELADMTKERFKSIRENLYCPNMQCDARIEYASGDKKTFFRTKRSVVDGEKIVEQHIQDCPYSVEHELELKRRKKYDPSLYVGISDKHLNDALTRAYRKYIDPEYGKKQNTGGNKTKSKSQQSKKDETSIIRGKASLTTPVNDDEQNQKEPALFQKNINDISEIDYGTVKTVSGEMVDFIIEENYKYIELKLKDKRRGRIYFGEFFRVNNEAQYNQLDNYKLYFDKKSKYGKSVFVACVGEIKKDDFDVSVVMSNYKGIKIDDRKHYQILELV